MLHTALSIDSTCHVQDEEKALETLMSKRTALQAKRSELERKIKDLGSLPSEAFEKYHDHTLQDLRKLLHKANTQLKKFRYGVYTCDRVICQGKDCADVLYIQLYGLLALATESTPQRICANVSSPALS